MLAFILHFHCCLPIRRGLSLYLHALILTYLLPYEILLVGREESGEIGRIKSYCHDDADEIRCFYTAKHIHTYISRPL